MIYTKAGACIDFHLVYAKVKEMDIEICFRTEQINKIFNMHIYKIKHDKIRYKYFVSNGSIWKKIT